MTSGNTRTKKGNKNLLDLQFTSHINKYIEYIIDVVKEAKDSIFSKNMYDPRMAQN
jgi:hypothetical protein